MFGRFLITVLEFLDSIAKCLWQELFGDFSVFFYSGKSLRVEVTTILLIKLRYALKQNMVVNIHHKIIIMR